MLHKKDSHRPCIPPHSRIPASFRSLYDNHCKCSSTLHKLRRCTPVLWSSYRYQCWSGMFPSRPNGRNTDKLFEFRDWPWIFSSTPCILPRAVAWPLQPLIWCVCALFFACHWSSQWFVCDWFSPGSRTFAKIVLFWDSTHFLLSMMHVFDLFCSFPMKLDNQTD